MNTNANPAASSVEELKRAAAIWSATQLHDGMVVGLGSGSTATLAVAAIGERVRQGLRIVGIPTSERTADQARSLNIPLATLGDVDHVDLTIDGADEVELNSLNLIKGGGGNQLREKIVASASAGLLIVVDAGKVVPQLGAHSKVPVEVAQFGWQSTARKLRALGATPHLRLKAEDRGSQDHSSDDQPYITDGGNYILDCAFGPITSAVTLQQQLDSVVGVVEHGLFIGMAARVVIGKPEGVELLERH